MTGLALMSRENRSLDRGAEVWRHESEAAGKHRCNFRSVNGPLKRKVQFRGPCVMLILTQPIIH